MTDHCSLMMLTKAQKSALECCVDYELTPLAASVLGVRSDVLKRLCWGGLIRFRPYAKDPHWAITSIGKSELDKVKQRGH